MKYIIKQKYAIDEEVAGIKFNRGIGEGEISEYVAEWFENHGYEVTKVEEPKKEVKENKKLK